MNGGYVMHGFNKASHTTSAIIVTGRSVAHMKRPAQYRAALAARLVDGRVVLSPLTISQASVICRVSYPLIAAALGRGESLAEHIARSTPAQQAEAAKVIGVGAIWDSMIVPNVS
jgi:hypothetical protein